MNSRFVQAGGATSRKYYHDEVWDVLEGDMEGSPVYPYRLKGEKVSRRDGFQKNVLKSYRLESADGDQVLFHETRPAHNKDVQGQRKASFGWKIVPTRKHADHLMCKVSIWPKCDKSVEELNSMAVATNSHSVVFFTSL